MPTIVVLTPEEARSSDVINSARVEADLATAELDIAKAAAETARADIEALGDESVSADVLAAVQREVAAAEAAVAALEADATSKGIPLSLVGTRYRIYNTSG